ncbi:MAG: ABC transporter substrate-binding protein [Desulfovibrio sp.]|nr:ABC transporter substrate-binding protein [Desulfovibrio sp.]
MLLGGCKVKKTCCSLLLVCLFLLGGVLTVKASPARMSLEASLDEVLSAIKDPAYSNPATRQSVRKKIANIVKRHFDFVEFSSRTLGQNWTAFSAEQKSSFVAAFSDLLIYTYLGKIDGYNGEKIILGNERVSSKGNRCEIATTVTLQNGKKIPVSYRMLPKDGDWKVYDVLVENISLVKNYRTQFQDLLRTDKPDALIARIRAKANDLEQGKNAAH